MHLSNNSIKIPTGPTKHEQLLLLLFYLDTGDGQLIQKTYPLPEHQLAVSE